MQTNKLDGDGRISVPRKRRLGSKPDEMAPSAKGLSYKHAGLNLSLRSCTVKKNKQTKKTGPDVISHQPSTEEVEADRSPGLDDYPSSPGWPVPAHTRPHLKQTTKKMESKARQARGSSGPHMHLCIQRHTGIYTSKITQNGLLGLYQLHDKHGYFEIFLNDPSGIGEGFRVSLLLEQF